MDPVKQAKAIARKAEEVTSLSMAAAYPSGQNQRLYDYVKVDLPLMIEAYEGRNPADLPDITDRQKNLLAVTPDDLKEKILKDEETARRTMGWVVPHSPDEIRYFVTQSQTPSSIMLESLVEWKKSQQQDNEAVLSNIINSEERPLDASAFEKACQNILTNREYKPGQPVKVWKEEGENGPFSGETRKIAQVKVSADDRGQYETTYRLENEEAWRYTGDLVDARGTQYGSGVIREEAGRLYYVELEKAEHYYDDNQLQAREIIGFQAEPKGASKVANDGKEQADNMRDILNVRRGQDLSGEFTYYPVKGYNDFQGPIVVMAKSWDGPPSEDESLRAAKTIQNHLNKFEYGEVVSDFQAPKMSQLNETEKPRAKGGMNFESIAMQQGMQM